MGVDHVDIWSIGHFFSGMLMMASLLLPITVYFGVDISNKYSGFVVVVLVFLHQMWEWFENSPIGISMFKLNLGFPDYQGDSLNNTIGDTASFVLGISFVLIIQRVLTPS